MRITEVKFQSVKIIYKPSVNQIKIGDFLELEEFNVNVIAQVVKIAVSSIDNDFNTAYLNIILTKKQGKFLSWHGETVSKNASVAFVSPYFYSEYLNIEDFKNTLCFGNILQFTAKKLYLPLSKFSAPVFIGFDRQKSLNDLAEKLVSEFSRYDELLLLLDFKGNCEFKGAERLVAGADIKLPLTSSVIDDIYAGILEGISLESKAVIEDVFIEVSKYADECKSGFIPFSSFKSVVNDIYEKLKIPQLVILKNKLIKYEKLNLFADKESEVFGFFDKLKKAKTLCIDFSEIPLEWHKTFMTNFLNMNQRLKNNFYMYVCLDEENSDNKIINNLLFKTAATGLKPIIASNYKYIQIDNIIDFSKNIILLKSHTQFNKQNEIFNFITALPENAFLISGELTKDLFMLVDMSSEVTETEEAQTTTVKIPAVNPDINIEEGQEIDFLQKEIDIDEFHMNKHFDEVFEDDKPKEVPYEIEEITTGTEEVLREEFDSELVFQDEELTVEEEFPEPEVVDTECIPAYSEPDTSEITPAPHQEVIPPAGNIFEDGNDENDFDTEVVENIEFPQDDSLVNLEDMEAEEVDLDELDFSQGEQEEDVDADVAINSIPVVKQGEEPQIDTNDDEFLDLLQEDDLDIDDFDEIAIDGQMVEEPSGLPVYSADYDEKEDNTDNTNKIEEGMLVEHQKYGRGIVKKIITHGNKQLCSINFDEFGRRLLDPDISQLTILN
ncbi:MAG: hypothetical protein PHX18_06880 [Candidatus Gastranaerophilales bacterium]|nr:hypothetical protein [Candidatus Gastranaerophilales bacterium]